MSRAEATEAAERAALDYYSKKVSDGAKAGQFTRAEFAAERQRVMASLPVANNGEDANATARRIRMANEIALQNLTGRGAFGGSGKPQTKK